MKGIYKAGKALSIMLMVIWIYWAVVYFVGWDKPDRWFSGTMALFLLWYAYKDFIEAREDCKKELEKH